VDLNLVLVLLVITIALAFDFTNGFHDAANAIATSVSTRALTPRVALVMAAVMNVVGALLGTEVAKTIGEGIIDISHYSLSTDVSLQREGLVIVLGALLGACTWNLITWWFGLPSSSSHALIGGLVGAGLMSSTQVKWTGILESVIIPMFASPLLGFFLGYLAMKLVMRIFANFPYHRTMRHFRMAQTVSAAAMALGHGLQDAQKTMGVIVMALVAGGYGEHHNIFDPVTGDMTIPLWVKLSAAGAISLGTYSGGWRIMRTLGGASSTWTRPVASSRRRSRPRSSTSRRSCSTPPSRPRTPSPPPSWAWARPGGSPRSGGVSRATSSWPGSSPCRQRPVSPR